VSKLSAAHLRKRYKARTVVHDVSLEVASGEVVGLLGPNGAGKTTCFYMIVGLVAPDGGEIGRAQRGADTASGSASRLLAYGPIALDTDRHVVSSGGKAVVLSNYISPAIHKHCVALGADAVFHKAHDMGRFIEYCSALV